jgi:hypothetical protein
MENTTDKGFKGLAMGELNIEQAAVGFHQAKAIELALVPLVIQDTEVAPVDLETVSGRWLDAKEGPRRRLSGPDGLEVGAQNTVTPSIAQRHQPLLDDGGTGGEILGQ